MDDHWEDPEVRERFVRVVGERIDDGQYRLKGLPRNRDFRDVDDYKTIECGWLKVHDVGFSAPAFEFSEHETDVIVEQKNEGGGTNIRFEPFEG